MLGLYPWLAPRLYPTGGNVWLTLAITGVVLLGLVVWAWDSLRRARRQERAVASVFELPKAA